MASDSLRRWPTTGSSTAARPQPPAPPEPRRYGGRATIAFPPHSVFPCATLRSRPDPRPMKAHIVLAHPEPRSFNAHLADLARGTLEARG